LPYRAGAEHFEVLLRVETAQNAAEASMDTSPPIGGLNKRPVLKARAGEPLRVKWRMKNAFPHGTMKAVTVHFFVVREDDLGQKPVPDPGGDGGLVDNSFTMDFARDAEATGSLRFRIRDAGFYLVRVGSEGTQKEHDHEHFAAVDV